VALLEAGNFPRHKVCGEFISGEALHLLAELIPSDRLHLLRQAPSISRSRLFLDGKIVEVPVNPPAASVPRFDLDRALWEAAVTSGVEACEQTKVLSISGTGPFRCIMADRQVEARALVNATGRWSNLHKVQTGSSHWIGLKAHFREPIPSPTVDLYFFEGGYCGVQPTGVEGQGLINASAMVRADIASSFPAVLARHAALAERSARWEALFPPIATAPLVFGTPRPVRDGMMMVGDAAGFVDPFVGDGISLALRSGALAAASLAAFVSGEIPLTESLNRYADRYRRHLLPVFRTSSALRRLLALPGKVRIPLLTAFEYAPGLKRYLVSKTR
jgi:flavin-dependent dehydrogenase